MFSIFGKNNAVRQVDPSETDFSRFSGFYTGSIILSQDNRILLQLRGDDWDRFPGHLSTFGGKMDSGETPIEGLVRELKEELGAHVFPADVKNMGAITEAATNYTELIYVFFWHDKNGSITGCYEGEAQYFESCATALKHPRIMDDVRWLLQECRKRKLINR